MLVGEAHNEVAKQCLNGAALCVTAGTIMGYLPAISAALSIIWLAFEIFEIIEKRIEKWKAGHEKDQ